MCGGCQRVGGFAKPISQLFQFNAVSLAVRAPGACAPRLADDSLFHRTSSNGHGWISFVRSHQEPIMTTSWGGNRLPERGDGPMLSHAQQSVNDKPEHWVARKRKMLHFLVLGPM